MGHRTISRSIGSLASQLFVMQIVTYPKRFAEFRQIPVDTLSATALYQMPCKIIELFPHIVWESSKRSDDIWYVLDILTLPKPLYVSRQVLVLLFLGFSNQSRIKRARHINGQTFSSILVQYHNYYYYYYYYYYYHYYYYFYYHYKRSLKHTFQLKA